MWRKTQERVKIGDNWVRVWLCRCGTKQASPPPQDIKVKPKVLYFDIETALSKYANFGRFVPSKFMRTDALIERSFIISWAAGWIDESDTFQYVISDCVRQHEAQNCDDMRVLKSLSEYMNVADYVVGHNSDPYDVKTVNYRLIANHMEAPFISKQIDTLKLAKKYFRADSNKLEEWSLLLGGKPKRDMEFSDWYTISMTGDPATLLKMEMYCRGDVREGIRVFKEMRKWIESSGRKLIK